ncbi:Carbon dioxide concentrating mechanism/carboxysome shell protein [Raoultella terrigena]|uniref:Carbon dioxide concentrating mechanism/carboxysome shell protein n=1 Tax=Raoultella terrigena TaxID=577 RepID=A0A485B9G9_RAOTE|nr:Carbon dioxide concentrating mechanism/carboxysome shell protein [Raoultella terrigena]
MVSVCFEGEISAIHTAIERGVEVVAAGQVVGSLVIARPERSVVDALGKLKGRPSRPAAQAEAPAAKADASLPPQEKEPAAPYDAQPAADQAEDKNAAQRRGKKA